MATVTVRNLAENTKRALQHRAVQHGVSMEQEIRAILDEAAKTDVDLKRKERRDDNLYDAIRKLVEPYGGFDLDIPPREPMREPPKFE